MTIYETVKAAVTVRQAAEHYGLDVNRNGMTSPTGGGKGYEACEDEEERVKAVEILLKDGKMQELEARLEQIGKEEQHE